MSSVSYCDNWETNNCGCATKGLCSSCTFAGCGWCSSNSICLSGDIDGPNLGICYEWKFNSSLCTSGLIDVCNVYADCDSCTASSNCDWCESSSKCVYFTYGCTDIRDYSTDCPVPELSQEQVIAIVVGVVFTFANALTCYIICRWHRYRRYAPTPENINRLYNKTLSTHSNHMTIVPQAGIAPNTTNEMLNGVLPPELKGQHLQNQ